MSRGEYCFLGTCLAIRLKKTPGQENYGILKPRIGELTWRLDLLPPGGAAAHGVWERECGVEATYNRDCLRLMVVISLLDPQKGTVPCQGGTVEPGQLPPDKETLSVGFRSTHKPLNSTDRRQCHMYRLRRHHRCETSRPNLQQSWLGTSSGALVRCRNTPGESFCSCKPLEAAMDDVFTRLLVLADEQWSYQYIAQYIRMTASIAELCRKVSGRRSS